MMPTQESTVSREALYAQVWSTPLLKLAESYGVSNVALAKVCRKLNVPVPGRGYWAKVAAGHPVEQRPLPRTAKHQSATIRPVRRKPADAEVRRMPTADTLARIGPIDAAPVMRPHPLTVRTRRHFADAERRLARAAKARQAGRSLPPGDWPPSEDHGRLQCTVAEGYPLTVSLAALDRALQILDALARALEKQGFRFLRAEELPRRAASNKYPGLCVVKDDERLYFRCREGYSRRERTAAELAAAERAREYVTKCEYLPNGRLAIELEGDEYGLGAIFRDAGNVRLENELGRIVAAFVEAVPRQRDRRAAREAEERERRLAEHRAWEERERVRKEKEALEALMLEAERSRRFQVLRDYLDQLERTVRLDGEVSPEGQAWLSEMRTLVDRYDSSSRRLRGEGPA